MKKTLLLAAFITLFLAFKAEAKAPAYFEFGIFYSSLAPHGAWIELEPGLVVWRPTIMKRWAPYQSGRWIWTSYGWYWDSYEPFGHIVYHYGRWYYDDYYGWIWIPDDQWGPAWVEWRYDDDYIGWAPLPPYATFSINIGIVFTTGYHTPYHHWHFVKYRHFCDPYPYNYYIAEKHKYRIHSRTKYRSDYEYRGDGVYNRGVDVNVVRKRSGREVRQRDLMRVDNERDLRQNRGKDDERIRTFVASRDELRKSSSDRNDVRIERSGRKSSLETSKIELSGRRNDTGRNDVREDVRSDRNSKGTFDKRGSNNEIRKESRERNNDSRGSSQNNDVRKEQQKKEQRTDSGTRNNDQRKESVERKNDQRKESVERNNNTRRENVDRDRSERNNQRKEPVRKEKSERKKGDDNPRRQR